MAEEYFIYRGWTINFSGKDRSFIEPVNSAVVTQEAEGDPAEGKDEELSDLALKLILHLRNDDYAQRFPVVYAGIEGLEYLEFVGLTVQRQKHPSEILSALLQLCRRAACRIDAECYVAITGDQSVFSEPIWKSPSIAPGLSCRFEMAKRPVVVWSNVDGEYRISISWGGIARR